MKKNKEEETTSSIIFCIHRLARGIVRYREKKDTCMQCMEWSEMIQGEQQVLSRSIAEGRM